MKIKTKLFAKYYRTLMKLKQNRKKNSFQKKSKKFMNGLSIKIKMEKLFLFI